MFFIQCTMNMTHQSMLSGSKMDFQALYLCHDSSSHYFLDALYGRMEEEQGKCLLSNAPWMWPIKVGFLTLKWTVRSCLCHFYSYLYQILTSLKDIILVIVEQGIINFINEIFVILTNHLLKKPTACSKCLLEFLSWARVASLDFVCL